jgi:thiamine biosynthesis lipoprotein
LDDPREDGRALAILGLGPGAVATSSITRRRWQQGEDTKHHLIDPRTGMPAETDWLSVTVIAEHADVAEVFAKALLIAGPRDAPSIARTRADITYIGVDRLGNMWGSDRVKEYLDGGNASRR